MAIVAIGWLFVVGCMAIVEAVQSSIAGAIVTFVVYGVAPLALVLWLMGTPQRRRDRSGRRTPVAGASFTPGSRKGRSRSARPFDP